MGGVLERGCRPFSLEKTMDFKEYQEAAKSTAIYPMAQKITYPLIGLVGEVGEFANKYKKVYRDGTPLNLEDAKRELGDIQWYLTNLADDMGISLNDAAELNVKKLADRMERGVIKGSGDNR